MKEWHISALIIYLSSTLFPCLAQDYTPFYLDNAKWTMESIRPILGPEDGHAYWEIYTLHDTLINNTSYRIVATRNLCELTPDIQGNLQYNHSLNGGEFIFGAIREENKKVYFLRFNNEPAWRLLQGKLTGFDPGSEYLLYDFDVMPNDTVHFSDLEFFTVSNGDTSYFTVDHFTIVLEELMSVQGHRQHRIVNSSAFAFPNETSTLLEGIGSSNGFFGSYDSHLNYLRCFSLNDEPLIFEDDCSPCAGFVATGEVDDPETLEVYPNPVRGMVNLEHKGNGSIHEVTILNGVGQPISSHSFSTKKVQPDLSGLPSGIFFLVIRFENGAVVIRKVIKG